MKKNIFISSIFYLLIIIQFQQAYSSTVSNYNNFYTHKDTFFIVKKIHVVGKTKYDDRFISELSGISTGDRIDMYGITTDNIIKKLWKSNLFKNISIYRKNIYKNEIDLFFELDDLEEIHEIKVEGIKKDQFTKIRKIKIGEKISGDLIQSIKNDIQEYYMKDGYHEINIKHEIKKDKKNNKNVLYFYIDKGKKIEIEEILFDGNKILKNKELLSLINQNNKNLLSIISIIKKPLFVQENVKKYLKNIIRKYKSMGFIDIQVFLDSVWKKKSGDYGIKIKIIEGEKYTLENVHILGNEKLKTDFLKKIFSYKKGDIYNPIGIEKNILNPSYPNSLLYAYLNSGYLFVDITFIEKKILYHKVDLEIQIKENQPVYINQVIILGNSITKDYVIRRELKTYPGDLFSIENIKYSLLHLYNLNLFDKVYYEIKPNKKNGLINIEWHVVEKNTNEFQFHGGFGGKNFKKVIGNFKLNFGNFSIRNILNWSSWNPIPQGDGQKLTIHSQLGKDFISYGFSFTEPWLERKNPTSFTFKSQYSIKRIENEEDLSFLHQKYNKNPKNEEKQFLEKIGGSIHFNKYLTFLDPYSKILTSVDYEKIIYKKEIFSNSYQKHGFNDLSYLISLQRLTTEPNFIFPFQGSEIELNSMFTIPYSVIFTNNKNKEWMEYFKLKIILFWYHKIVDNIILKTGGELGYLGQYNNEKELFSYQKFYMGGVHNSLSGSNLYNKDHIPLRGYSYKDQIFNNGGRIYDKFILEIRYLIKNLSNLKIWTTCFMEGGNISNSYQKFNPLRMNKSFGFGFRLFWEPIGFLGVDFGYPIDNNIIHGLNKSKWKTHFIIGKNL
ncbi:BamA/TamA family outer membrane protein [Blattabacterium sp. DPU]|uniref:BamA/OMP85 family outer membrane protein n=1 Tax=Blattabacterium sp. DPU TaxID=2715232 RepID=UPI0014097D59|nr:POTRA domain-containing protein [Blattabacterium sp. DPU]QIK16499.1 BamA/TamA family outer membrane protein [Blattabacterium sp. DPU]